MRTEEDDLPVFLQDVVDVLSVLRFGSNDFLQYIQNVDIRDSFEEGESKKNQDWQKNLKTFPHLTDTKYTALIPFDEAFRRWYPIDWGFNPFDVDSFARQTLLDHFLVGDVGDRELVEDGATFLTAGGRRVVFSRDPGDPASLSANGVRLVEGGTPVPHGSLLFVDQLLFVDAEAVESLRAENGWLESGPLLPRPWYQSQFLSHALQLVSEREGFSYMAEYMNSTEELGDYAQGYGRRASELLVRETL